MACAGKGGVTAKRTVVVGLTGRTREASTGVTRNRERLPEQDLEGYVEVWEEEFCVEEEVAWEYQAICGDGSIEVLATATTWRRTSDCFWRSMHEKHEPTKDISQKAVTSICVTPEYTYTCGKCCLLFRYDRPARLQHCPVCHEPSSEITPCDSISELSIDIVEEEICFSTDELKELIGEELDSSIKEGVSFVPDCDKEYTTHVYNRLLIKDCDNITDEEKKEMSDALIAKGMNSAGIICSLNKGCQNPKLLKYQFDRITCCNRLWEVDLTWTFKCVE